MTINWPKDVTTWAEGRQGFMSVPFTWLLPKARVALCQRRFDVDRWLVGGPATLLLPGYVRDIPHVTVGGDMPGVLQRVNPQATRTTIGCPRRCQFCAVGQRLVEPEYRELPDWPNRPIICDNNLTAASESHFARVIRRLQDFVSPDFNQGLDARLLTPWHAAQLATLNKPIIRLALDNDAGKDAWERAYGHLRAANIAKRRIRTYVLVGFGTTPEADWQRCEWVEQFGVKAFPQWFHRLDALRHNEVTGDQRNNGWTTAGRIAIMRYYYKHAGEPLHAIEVELEARDQCSR